MRYLICILLLQISLSSGGYAGAQQLAGQQAGVAQALAVALPPKPLRTVRILQVASITNPRRDTLRLNDQILMRVIGLRQLMEAQNIKPEALRLYVDNVMLPTPPVAVDTRFDSDTATVRFFLQRDAKTESTWQLFYKLPFKYEHPAHIGLGVVDGQLAEAYPARNENVLLELIRPWHLVVALLLVAVFLIGMVWLARNSSLLRNDWSSQLDPSTSPDTSYTGPIALPAIAPKYRMVSFSLLKVQKRSGPFWD